MAKHKSNTLTAALHRFWGTVWQRQNRIGILREYAAIEVESYHRYLDVRRGHGSPAAHLAGRCFACGSQPKRLHIHHIIQVQHGGRNTEKNLVPICGKCHRAIHPWMHKEQPVVRALVTMEGPRLVRKRPLAA